MKRVDYLLLRSRNGGGFLPAVLDHMRENGFKVARVAVAAWNDRR